MTKMSAEDLLMDIYCRASRDRNASLLEAFEVMDRCPVLTDNYIYNLNKVLDHITPKFRRLVVDIYMHIYVNDLGSVEEMLSRKACDEQIEHGTAELIRFMKREMIKEIDRDIEEKRRFEDENR